jgi:hypothetical protein
MNRRAFLALSAALPLTHLQPAFSRQPPRARELKADLVVIGGGVGGVACALAAARTGLKVILTEEYEWVGGQLTSQAVPPDEHPWIEEQGSTRTYRDFRTKVRDYYRRNYPLTEEARKNPKLNPGNGSVSKLCHEPRVALAVLLEMLAPHVAAGRVTLLQPYVPVLADVRADVVENVEVAQIGGPGRFSLQAPYFVDATETGELLPLTKTEYVTGAEARRDTKEPHAPLDANPDNHQAFTYCLAIDYQEGKDNRIAEPPGYQKWLGYMPQLRPRWPGNLLAWEMSDPKTLKSRAVGFNPTGAVAKGLNLWTYRRILDRDNCKRSFFTRDAFESDICLVNWPQNDYWLGNLYDAPRDEVATSHRLARELSLALLYWMQTDAPRPDGRHGWRGLRLRGDVTGTADRDGLAMAPYVRESRRIQALFTVTENHVGVDARANLLKKKPGEFTAEPFPDAVGTGSYRIDLHPSSAGDNYIDVSSLPFQIPLGALIPKRVENLLPACKNIGTTHITNGCYRLHPVEWSIGEAVGELAAFCLSKKRVPRQVRKDAKLLAHFQTRLARVGVDLEWPEEIAKTVR